MPRQGVGRRGQRAPSITAAESPLRSQHTSPRARGPVVSKDIMPPPAGATCGQQCQWKAKPPQQDHTELRRLYGELLGRGRIVRTRAEHEPNWDSSIATKVGSSPLVWVWRTSRVATAARISAGLAAGACWAAAKSKGCSWDAAFRTAAQPARFPAQAVAAAVAPGVAHQERGWVRRSIWFGSPATLACFKNKCPTPHQRWRLLEGDVLSDAHSYPVSPVLAKTIAADGARAGGMGTERMPCHPRHGRCPGNTAFAEPHPNTPSEEMRCCVAGWLACARGIPQTQSPVYLLPA